MPGNHRSGRKPKPTALHKLAGNPGKRAVPKDEPRLPAKRPKWPRGANLDAREKWLWRWYCKLLVDQMQVVTEADATLLVLIVHAHRRREQLRAKTLESGEWTTQQKGYTRKDGTYVDLGEEHKRAPWAIAMERAQADLHRYLGECGLTPAQRTRVQKAGGAETEADRRRARYLPGGA